METERKSRKGEKEAGDRSINRSMEQGANIIVYVLIKLNSFMY